jgi:hypothetical protein
MWRALLRVCISRKESIFLVFIYKTFNGARKKTDRLNYKYAVEDGVSYGSC